MNNSHTDRIRTGSLYHVTDILDQSPAKDDEWFTEHIIVRGDTITVKVDDKQVAPTPHVAETTVTRADAPKVLEYNWGGQDIRWELDAVGGGTRLTLWHNIDRGLWNRPCRSRPSGPRT